MKKAYSTIEMLVSILLFSMILVVTIQFQKNLMLYIKQYDVKRVLSFYKIQQILAKSKIEDIDSNSIQIIYESKTYKIKLHNNRIVKVPGYHILLDNIEGYFSVENNCIYINQRKLYCEKGIR